MSYLDFEADFNSPAILAAYDEQPLWSAMFGLMMLDYVPLRAGMVVLDVGCGTGFPLIEIAERLGPGSVVHGLDPWAAGLRRANEKIAARQTRNVELHEGSAASMPFAGGTFDLIVSNLGVNNFDDRKAAIAECRRVAKPDATIALTTNLQGHMRELYDAFAEVLRGDREATRRLREHRRLREATARSSPSHDALRTHPHSSTTTSSSLGFSTRGRRSFREEKRKAWASSKRSCRASYA